MAAQPLADYQLAAIEDGLPAEFVTKTTAERAAVWLTQPPVRSDWHKREADSMNQVAKAAADKAEAMPRAETLIHPDKMPSTKEVKETADRADKKAAGPSQTSVYNQLAREATSLGLKGFKEIASFKSSELAEAAIGHIESSIKAFNSGQRAADEQERTVSAAAAVRKSPAKASKAPAKKTAVKKATVAKAPAAEKEVRAGIVGLFGSREGTLREDIILALEKGKAVKFTDLAKKLKSTPSNIKASVIGLKLMIAGNNPSGKKLPYEVVTEGRGDDATIAMPKTK